MCFHDRHKWKQANLLVQTNSVSFVRLQVLLLTQEILTVFQTSACRNYSQIPFEPLLLQNMCNRKTILRTMSFHCFPSQTYVGRRSYSHANAAIQRSSWMSAVLQEEFGRSKNSDQFFPGRRICSKLSGWIEKFEEAWTFAQKISQLRDGWRDGHKNRLIRTNNSMQTSISGWRPDWMITIVSLVP